MTDLRRAPLLALLLALACNDSTAAVDPAQGAAVSGSGGTSGGKAGAATGGKAGAATGGRAGAGGSAGGAAGQAGAAGAPSGWSTPPLPQLEGPVGDAALKHLPRVLGAELGADEIAEDDRRFVHTRLSAVLAADASVATVNAALTTFGASIVAALEGYPLVTLSVPPMANREEARQKADLLAASPAFVAAYPVHLTTTTSMPPSPGESRNTNLFKPRTYAAWNLAGLAKARANQVSVVVMDNFAHLTPHPLVSAQRFDPRDTRAFTILDKNGRAPGNHGDWVTGVLAADFDAAPPVGTSPDPKALLDLLCLQIAFLDPLGVVLRTLTALPEGAPSIVNLSLGYNDPEEDDFERDFRLHLGMLVRQFLVDQDLDQVLFVTAAGNDGDAAPLASADFSFPFNTQARIGDPLPFVSNAGRPGFEANWKAILAARPEMATPQGHTIIVGGSEPDEGPYVDETPFPDVRMLARDVVGACTIAEEGGCEEQITTLTGTSGATPQVAGLAAYLWNLEPALTAAELRQTLVGAYDGSIDIDAFQAVLALESTPHATPVRKALADIDGDDRFGITDVVAVLDAMDAAAAATPVPGKAVFDFSRLDLNGDGFTRADTRRSFDLDGDGSLKVVSFSVPDRPKPVQLLETAVSDLDVLCFLAFSSRFDPADASARNTILLDRCSPAVKGGWTGTLTVDSTVTRVKKGCDASDPTEVATLHLVDLQISCPPFDPATEKAYCVVLAGSGAGSFDSGFDTGLYPISNGGAPCAIDSDCTGGSVCGFATSCPHPTGSPSGPRQCMFCEAYVRKTEKKTGSGSADVAGSDILSFYPFGGSAHADISNVKGVFPVTISTETTYTVSSANCGDLKGETETTNEVYPFGNILGEGKNKEFKLQIAGDTMTGTLAATTTLSSEFLTFTAEHTGSFTLTR